MLDRPPFDPAVQEFLEANPGVTSAFTLADLPFARALLQVDDISEYAVDRRDVEFRSFDRQSVGMSVFTPRHGSPNGAAILYLHGGGMVVGTRESGLSLPLSWAARYGVVVASVEYRLAPDHPFPVPVEDCYAAMAWLGEHSPSLGIDPDRILALGTSAGGCLAAALTLLARDRGGPGPSAQMLLAPMLDDRCETPSAQQFADSGVWSRECNLVGWGALLGTRRGRPDVSEYAAPARASDLSRLPPAYLDVGSAEALRDEVVTYATRIWQAGGAAELHVWPGASHGTDISVPSAAVSIDAHRARDAWIRRFLHG